MTYVANYSVKDVNDEVRKAADIISSFLGVKKLNVIRGGGPCAADPMGSIAYAFSIVDAQNQGFWITLDDRGFVIEAGASIDGQSVKFPQTIQL